MANEITVVGANHRNIQVLMLFPVAVPAQDADGTPIIPTPSANLPTVGADKLTLVEKDQLDAGTLVFEIGTMLAELGLSPAAILAKAQENYAARLAAKTTEYVSAHQFLPHVGSRFNAE